MKKPLVWLTLLHLLVDGLCGAVLAVYAIKEPNMAPIIYYFSLYTIWAFGLQGPVGYFFDRHNKYLWQGLIIAIGILCIGAVPQLPIVIQATFLGLGNCLYHVTGGSFVLQSYGNYGPLGCFVASGAIGLGLGLSSFVEARLFVVGTILVGLVAAMVMKKGVAVVDVNPSPILAVSNKTILVCAIFLLVCIVLRGFSGAVFLEETSLITLACVLATGKFSGGILVDKLGLRKAVLAIFGLGFIALQLQGNLGVYTFIFACNMTMPLTLRLLHSCYPSKAGMMFGVAAGCLVPGVLFKGCLQLPAQLILVLQFLILTLAGNCLVVEGGNKDV